MKVEMDFEIKRPGQQEAGMVAQEMAIGCLHGIHRAQEKLSRSGFDRNIDSVKVGFRQIYSHTEPFAEFKIVIRPAPGKGKEFELYLNAEFEKNMKQAQFVKKTADKFMNKISEGLAEMRLSFERQLKQLPIKV
jgi:hypothetical protein